MFNEIQEEIQKLYELIGPSSVLYRNLLVTGQLAGKDIFEIAFFVQMTVKPLSAELLRYKSVEIKRLPPMGTLYSPRLFKSAAIRNFYHQVDNIHDICVRFPQKIVNHVANKIINHILYDDPEIEVSSSYIFK